jgi:hypothetical protein
MPPPYPPSETHAAEPVLHDEPMMSTGAGHDHDNSYAHAAPSEVSSPPQTPNAASALHHAHYQVATSTNAHPHSHSHSYSLPPPTQALPPQQTTSVASHSTPISAPASVQHTQQHMSPVTDDSVSDTINICLQLLRKQAEDHKRLLQYLQRREEREEEIERARQKRENAEWERLQQSAKMKQKSEAAMEVLSNPSVPDEYKKAAGEYLKKFFATD